MGNCANTCAGIGENDKKKITIEPNDKIAYIK